MKWVLGHHPQVPVHPHLHRTGKKSIPGRLAMGAGTAKLSPGAGVTPWPQAVTSVDTQLGAFPLTALLFSAGLLRLPCWRLGVWGAEGSGQIPNFKTPDLTLAWAPSYLQAGAAQGHSPTRRTSHSSGWPLNRQQDLLGKGWVTPSPQKKNQRRSTKKMTKRGLGTWKWGSILSYCTLPQRSTSGGGSDPPSAPPHSGQHTQCCYRALL